MSNYQHRVLVAHPGTQYAPRLAAELHRQGALGRFATGSALGDGGFLEFVDNLIPTSISRRWANRRAPGVPAVRLSTFPGLELRALCSLRRGETAEQVFFRRNEAFQRVILDDWIEDATHVVGFDTSSWLLAGRANDIGRPFFLDQSIGHSRAKEQTYSDVRARYPQWADDMKHKAGELLALEDAEHAKATRIVAASSFSRRTLIDHGIPVEKIAVIPYGVDTVEFRPRVRTAGAKRPMRFLFVGLVNARKGIPLLLEAWREVAKTGAELWLVGPVTDEVRALIPSLPGLRVLGRRPHGELPQLFANCDVFVFPSFFEGFALVLLEAMACGLPIIATDATAAPDLITEGREGFVLAPADLDALAAKMLWFAEDSDRAAILGAAARRQAERFSWANYGDRWMALLSESTIGLPVRGEG
jgi:starch synthase